MRTVNRLINPAVNAMRTTQPAHKSPQINEEAKQIINDLFITLQAAKPAWRSAFPDDESLRHAKASYVKGLIEARMTDRKAIARGATRARLSPLPYFPGVGEFLAMCKPTPEDFGMPPAQAAWDECCANSHRKFAHAWSHAGVYEAGRRTGWFDIRNGAVKQKYFESAYSNIVDEIAQGVTFELPERNATMLEHTSGKKTRTEQARTVGLAAIRALKGLFTRGGL